MINEKLRNFKKIYYYRIPHLKISHPARIHHVLTSFDTKVTTCHFSMNNQRIIDQFQK